MSAAEVPMLEVMDLSTRVRSGGGYGIAVNGVSFHIDRGKTLALVGESGSGKSMTASSIMQLNPRPASEIVGGEVWLENDELLSKSEKEMVQLRGSKIGYIPQEPHTSLDPVFTIGYQIEEALRLHVDVPKRERRERAIELIKSVGVPMAADRMRSYPHELSGGMRQRILAAIAISCDPQVLICDEPTTALDVTVQADFLDLLADIQRERQLAILFITHDFGIVANMSDYVAVMYSGRIVERAATIDLFASTLHPYSVGLIDSLPDVTKTRGERLKAIGGHPPSIFNQPQGCPFAPRCPKVMSRCLVENPPLVEAEPGHDVACWAVNS